MQLQSLALLKARFNDERNFVDLIDTLAGINRPPAGMIQTNIPLLSAAGTTSVAHALNATPTLLQVALLCVGADSGPGYVAGQLVSIADVVTQVVTSLTPSSGTFTPTSLTTNPRAVSVAYDNQNVYIIQTAGSSALYVRNPTTQTWAAITPGSWQFYVYAEVNGNVSQNFNPYITLQPVGTNSGVFTINGYGVGTLTAIWQYVTSANPTTWLNVTNSVPQANTVVTTNSPFVSTLTFSSSTSGIIGYKIRCLVTDGNGNTVISNTAAITS